ncbi:MAG: type II toxin-antitoxin system ParD family antitoxin, partial [Chloroflexi bacterium]|nr:type II toxin-antitoxin system ParD family antitoxin [Chloroflexota bacterium]
CSAMSISISEQNQEHIKRKIESGQYTTPDEVIAKALALLDEQDEQLAQELDELRAKVRAGLEQADRGQLTPATEVFEELRRRNAARFEEL